MKSLSYLFLLALCLNCLNANPTATSNTTNIEDPLLEQIDEERMTHELYTKLFKEYPEIKLFKGMIADKKEHFKELVAYAKENHPDLKTGLLNDNFALPETKRLYSKWLKKGSESIEDALEAGIALEKLALKEISDFLNLEPEPELEKIIEDLKRDSKKHLASFRREKTRRNQ